MGASDSGCRPQILLFESGRLKNVAECTQCKRLERRPKDFK